jgi:hypothetical protein
MTIGEAMSLRWIACWIRAGLSTSSTVASGACRLHQESCRAIGEDLGISAKAVEKHITRGMIDLRRALDHAGIDLVGQD